MTLVGTPTGEAASGTATVASMAMAMDWARRAPDQVAMLEKDLDIRQELDISIVLVEHDMGLVMDIANRVLVLDFGEMISMGPPGEVQRDPAVIAAYLGDEAGFAAATE